MDSYGVAVRALDPLVSGTIESAPAPAIAENDPISVDNLLAAQRQLEWRRTVVLLRSHIVTEEELLEAELRFHVIKSLHFDRHGEHVPRWAQNIQAQFTQIQDQFLALQRTMEQRHQQALNRGLKTNTQPLEPVIRLSDGRVAPNFPETLEVLWNSDEETIEEWLRFYGLDMDHYRALLAKTTLLQTVFGILE